MFTTLATNNTANAQPESFTENYLMENYRGDEVVSSRLVTVTWDATANTFTFENFYQTAYPYDLTTGPITIVSIPSMTTWDETNTIATIKWREHFYCNMQKSVFVDFNRRHYTSTKWFFGFVSPAMVNSNTSNPYLDAFDGTRPAYGLSTGYVTVTYNMADDTFTFTPWGHFIRTERSSGYVGVVEYFERSVLKKTDLVDIINDGVVGGEYEVNDDLVGVATVDGVLSAPMGVSRNSNTFMINKGRYKLDFDVSTNTLTVSQSAEDVTGYVNNGSCPTYYVLGEANGNAWNPTVGQPMETTDGVHYSAVVNFYGNNENKNYFSLTSGLADNNDDGGWNYVNNDCRLGPSSNDYPVTMGDVLFAKDDGKYKYPSVMTEGQDDFMGRIAAEYGGYISKHPAENYDQSNWVMITGVSNASSYVGKIIKGKSITGKLVDKVNPTIAVTSNPTVGELSSYNPNLYIMPSFNENYYTTNSNYFFVAPKVQEYAYITWACYAADGNFYVPTENTPSDMTGGIKVNWDYLPSGNPQVGYVYEFDAILRKVPSTVSSAPSLKDAVSGTPKTSEASADYLVYPLHLYDVPTAIKTVETTGKVVDVKYYNLMGVESRSPFNGVNIVVETLDNGSHITSKKLYK